MELAGNWIVIIVWIVYTVICEIIYHKIFNVYYFSLSKGCLTELTGCGIAAAVLTGLTMYIYIPLAIIVIALGIAIPIVVPAMKHGDMPGKVLIRVIAVILTFCILLAGRTWKNNQEKSISNNSVPYGVSFNL